MDLLRKEMERKKRALAQAKSSMVGTAAAVVSGTAGAGDETTETPSGPGADPATGTTASNNSTRFLNASQLRKRQEEEEARLRRTTNSKRPRPYDPPPQPPEQEQQQQPRERQPPLDRHPSTTTSRITNSSGADGINPSYEQGKPPARIGDSRSRDAATSASPAGATQPPMPRKRTAGGGTERAREEEEDVTARLRSLGLPVRLFGEVGDGGDARRFERLQQALRLQQSALQSLSEKQEFRLGAGHGIRNPFLAKRGGTSGSSAAPEPRRAAARTGTEDGDDDSEDGDEEDPHKKILRYLKSLLVQWEHDLSLRPDSVKLSVAGKKETNTLQQCKDYIAPLFKLLKKRQLEASLTANLTKIVDCCQQDEFVLANDAYMDVAIGRAAWPIGVTQVGIHSRTGRSKIESSNVAHVMNSELQRKYLTSVKRLITYAQTKSAADPSKKVLY